MAAHAAPVTAAARAIKIIAGRPVTCEPRASVTPPAAVRPRTTCPSPPILVSPALAGTATAMALRMKAPARSRAWPNPYPLPIV